MINKRGSPFLSFMANGVTPDSEVELEDRLARMRKTARTWIGYFHGESGSASCNEFSFPPNFLKNSNHRQKGEH